MSRRMKRQSRNSIWRLFRDELIRKSKNSRLFEIYFKDVLKLFRELGRVLGRSYIKL